MRVLWVSHFLLYPATGFGALQRSRNLLSGLSSRAEVHLISLAQDAETQDRKLMESARTELESICASVQFTSRSTGGGAPKKAALFARSQIAGIPFSNAIYQSPELHAAVLTKLRDDSFDVVHADTMGLVEPILREIRSKAPTVLNHHNVESAMMERRAMRTSGGFRGSILKMALKREARLIAEFERRWCREFQLQLTVSPEDSAELVRRTDSDPAAVKVIENSVDTSFILARADGVAAPWRASTPKSLLFLGGMDWYPNRDAVTYFIREIWPALKARRSDLVLTVVGKDEGIKAQLASVLPANVPLEDVNFTGFVDDIRPYLANAAAFICPMRDGGGTRLKILDSLAAGIPLISTRVGCEGIAVVDGQQVLFAESVADWERCVEMLLSDGSLGDRLSRGGRALIEEQYSKDIVGERLFRAYEALNGSKARKSQV